MQIVVTDNTLPTFVYLYHKQEVTLEIILYFHRYAFKLCSYILQLCMWEGHVTSAMDIGISVPDPCYIYFLNSGLKGYD